MFQITSNQALTKPKLLGIGIYSNFRDMDVMVDTAVVTPDSGINMKNIFTVKLDNMGKIGSIINCRGPGPTPDTERGVPLRCLDESCCNSGRLHILDVSEKST